jgi:hypothetical protein
MTGKQVRNALQTPASANFSASIGAYGPQVQGRYGEIYYNLISAAPYISSGGPRAMLFTGTIVTSGVNQTILSNKSGGWNGLLLETGASAGTLRVAARSNTTVVSSEVTCAVGKPIQGIIWRDSTNIGIEVFGFGSATASISGNTDEGDAAFIVGISSFEISPIAFASITLFNTALSESARTSLVKDPGQIFKEPSRVRYFSTGGGGASSVDGNPIAFQWEQNSASVIETVNTTPTNFGWYGTTGTLIERVDATPVTFQWEVTAGTVSETLNSIPKNWEWSVTTGTLLEQLNASIVGFQWEVTTGSIEEAGFATDTIDTTPIGWEWGQTQASFINRLESSAITFQWEVTTASLTENLNAQPIGFQWELTTGTLLGTITLECVPVAWEWEVTSASFVAGVPEVGPATIGGKKDKTRKPRKSKLPYYESKDYESRIDLEDVSVQPEQPVVKTEKQAKVAVPDDIVVKADKEVKLISNLVSELKPIQKQEAKAVEHVVVVQEGFDEETAVIMLLLAA